MLKNWINIFIYHLKNNKLFTALNVLGLSIGIAGLIFAILYWNDEHSYDAWNPQKDKIFLLTNEMSENTFWASSSAPVGAAIKEKTSEIEAYCYMDGDYINDIIKFRDKKIQSDKIVSAQKNFFEFFPFDFVEGNRKKALPDENSICLSEELAFQIFGNESALGKELTIQNKKVLVRGVYKLDKKSSYNPSCVVNFVDLFLKKTITQWGNFHYVLMIKAKQANATSAITRNLEKLYYTNLTERFAKLNGMTPAAYAEKYGVPQPHLESLESIRLHTKTGGLVEGKGNYQFLLIMVGLSILILILSIVNYVNSATANSIKRAKEVGVRKIIGASKANIVQQFVLETILITLFSILLSLVIVELSLPYYNDFLEKTLTLQGSQFYLQLVIIFIVTVAVAGIFPAIYVSNFEVLNVLKGNFGRSKSGVWLRNGMLIFQFAIAAFFIIGSYIVYSQIDHMNKKDLGFKANQILNISYRNVYGEEITDDFRFNRYQIIKNELLRIKGVKKVAGGAFVFGKSVSTSSYKYKDIEVDGSNISIDFGMLEMLKIKLAKGRFLSPKFAQDTINTMLINEAALKQLNEKDPIGKKIDWNGMEVTIVGVVKDFNLGNPGDPIPPMSFFHFKTVPWLAGALNNIYVDVDAQQMEQALTAIQKFWAKNVDPDYPFTYDFVEKEYKRSYSNYVKQKNLFSLLNVIVILIALFGLFSLASFSIERKMKEIAIRKTLGAETNVLLKELSKQYVVYCVIGFLIALFPTYYLLSKWLENFAYRLELTIYPFLIGFIVLLLLTLVVVLSRAYQATKVDVLQYLKYE
ncbi:FtsX-like permease family protein [Flavobacterium sp. GA093]|uniref:FtsX-like permease family protein n=1 Tax=Flavobacterium hydrocarbonoxydans TaxID=2683249 RepID=A0A6I4NJH8_9FLAO|nr:ABC transporter permease [Flavobacterium hydrocarbonoxydans]MWB94331.1 FtsX-like permease family protein [Flavobacterium hydrocarbonoxydans]